MSEYLVGLVPYKVVARAQILAEDVGAGNKMMNVPAVWVDTEGAGVKMVVLDTGAPDHVDIELSGQANFVPLGPEIAGAQPRNRPVHIAGDANGHSTHVCGIVRATRNNGIGCVGVAPKCELWTGQVLDGDGSGELEWIVEGIYWATDVVQADVINMSMGIDAGAPLIREFKKACDYACSQGVTIVAAAGNEYGRVGQPACYESVIAVGAVNGAKEHAEFSNTGKEVDFAAFGVEVFSCWPKNGYAKLSGTSMAGPFVAGVATLIIAKHRLAGEELTPAEVKEHIRKIAFDVGPDGFDETFGWGIPVFGHGEEEKEEEEEEKEEEKGIWQRMMDWLTRKFIFWK